MLFGHFTTKLYFVKKKKKVYSLTLTLVFENSLLERWVENLQKGGSKKRVSFPSSIVNILVFII